MAQRRYDKEFKLNAVKLYKNGKKAADVCRDLGIPDATFYYVMIKKKASGGRGHQKILMKKSFDFEKSLKE